VSLAANFGTFAGCCGSSSVDFASACSLFPSFASVATFAALFGVSWTDIFTFAGCSVSSSVVRFGRCSLLSKFASATVFAALFGVSLTDNFGTFAGCCCGSSSIDCASGSSVLSDLASSVESSVACFTGKSDDFEVSGGGWLWFGSSSVVISTS